MVIQGLFNGCLVPGSHGDTRNDKELARSISGGLFRGWTVFNVSNLKQILKDPLGKKM